MTRFLFLLLTICMNTVHADEESLVPKSTREKRLESYGSVLDNKDKISSWFNSSKSEESSKTTTTHDIKKDHLWRASLDVVSFMPIAVSDAAGGVISTDWYEDTKNPNEKFKVNIVIKSSEVRAKSLQVTVFRKIFTDGDWRDATLNDKATLDIAENIKQQIIQKAQKLSS